jgi:excisionase family DNA binding protein
MQAGTGSAPETPIRYTIAEASALTGLSKRALARRIERGQLPAVKVGRLRYIEARALAEAGLLDLTTGEPPSWVVLRPPPDAVAREIVQTLVRQGIELHELQRSFAALGDESRRDHIRLGDEIEEARREREALRAALEQAELHIAELRRQIERLA